MFEYVLVTQSSVMPEGCTIILLIVFHHVNSDSSDYRTKSRKPLGIAVHITGVDHDKLLTNRTAHCRFAR